MSIYELKHRFHDSLSIFTGSVILGFILLFILLIFRRDFWVFCMIPGIFIFSVIGMRYVTKGLLVLTQKDLEQSIPVDEYLDKLYGIEGFRATFIVAAIIMWISILIIGIFRNPALFGTSNLSYAGIIFAAILLYDTYKVSQELSFIIMSVTIVKGIKSEKSRKEDVVNGFESN